jgi:glutathione peroxidase-family protein
MQAWNLQTEPWTFLVDASGTIVDRFEGTVSVDELETAVREKLVPSQ